MRSLKKKQRIVIPASLAALVLFASDRICCVCHRRGKPTQIHHIDGDPAHNTFPNLSVLCQNCHWETQQQGGFTRSLDRAQLQLYRNDWLRYVAWQRWDPATIPWSTHLVAEHLMQNYSLAHAIRNDARSYWFDLAPRGFVEAYYLVFYPALADQCITLYQTFARINAQLESRHPLSGEQHQRICADVEEAIPLITVLRAEICGAPLAFAQMETQEG